MDKFSISFTLGKASAEHGGNIEHNNREFTAHNVDEKKIKDNIVYKIQDIEDAYHELFDDAVNEYNQKQKQPCRRIKDYHESVIKNKQVEEFYEAVVQFGNVNDSPCGSPRGEIAKQMLDEYMKEFQKRNPNLHVFNAVLHLDEASPHIHIDFIPFYTKGRVKGLSKGTSMSLALDEQGFSASTKKMNRLVAWELSERTEMEKILKKHGFEREDKQATYEHMTVDDYKTKEAEENIIETLKQTLAFSDSELNKEHLQSLRTRLSAAEKKISKLEKEKTSPHKSFFYSDPDKQAFVQSKMDAADIPYVETENGFDAQECYVEQIRAWEKMFKSSTTTFREQLAADIDRLLMRCNDVNELYKKLEAEGYTIKHGKYVAARPPRAERFIRFKTLGEEYNERALQNRIQNSVKFERELQDKIDQAKKDNSPTYKTLTTMKFYTVTFKKGLLPCHKKFKQQPFSWTNDSELDKLLLLNKKISQGETIQSMKDEFEKSEKKLQEKNTEVTEAKKKVKRMSEGKEAFEVLFENKVSDIISKEQAVKYQERYPNINKDNYQQTKELAAKAAADLDTLLAETKILESEVRDLSGAISIAEQVRAGTYVQELVSRENLHRHADLLPNGRFKL